MNIKQLKLITKVLTGLELKIVDDNISWIFLERGYIEDTSVQVDTKINTIDHIQLNVHQIRKIRHKLIKRGFGIKNIYLKVILHEIAHVKHILKHLDTTAFLQGYNAKKKYYENLADRYARLNYKKVLIALNRRY